MGRADDEAFQTGVERAGRAVLVFVSASVQDEHREHKELRGPRREDNMYRGWEEERRKANGTTKCKKGTKGFF